MKLDRVAFINPQLPYPALVSYALFPEYGMHLVATIVRDAGYDVRVFVEHIGPIDWDQVLESDVVCFYTFTATMPQTVSHVPKIKAARPDMPIIIGGTHASVMSEDTLRFCDMVVRQEGDGTLLEVLANLKSGEALSRVLGISYWDKGTVKTNPNRPFVQKMETIPDLELIQGYMDWGKLKLPRNLRIRWQLIQTSRGCPFDCTFCIAPRELGRGYRLRSIIQDIKYQQNLVGAKNFFIVDNHFTVNPERTKELLTRIIDEGIKWNAICFSRLEVARDEEVFRLLKKANINTLYIGLESFDNKVLKLLNKKQTTDAITKSLKIIKKHGLWVLGSFVLGSDEDTVDSIRAKIDAAIENDIDLVALFPLTGYPEANSPTVPLDRFFTPTWDRLDGNFVTFLPKNMKPSTLQREVDRAYKKFYSPRLALNRILRGQFKSGLVRLAYSFGVWRMRRNTSEWTAYLESVEGGYYDENERLIEEELGQGINPAEIPGSSRAAGVDRDLLTLADD